MLLFARANGSMSGVPTAILFARFVRFSLLSFRHCRLEFATISLCFDLESSEKL